MDLTEILLKLESGDITAADAKQLIESLQASPKQKRGRPKKAKTPPKKNGRPRLLSTYERQIEIMAARVILDILDLPWTSTEKRKFLSDRYCVSEKAIEAHITELNRRAKNGEVEVCQITHAVRFISKQQRESAFFNGILDRKQTVHLRKVKLGKYSRGTPTKPPIK